MTATKNAPAVLEHDEGERTGTPTVMKEDRSLSSFQSTEVLSKTEADKVDAWCREMLAFYAANSQSIPEGDARREIFGSPERLAGFNPSDVGELWFTEAVYRGIIVPPAWPLPRPFWAVKAHVQVGLFPEMTVEFTGPEHTDDDRVTVYLSQSAVLFAGPSTDHSGEPQLDGSASYRLLPARTVMEIIDADGNRAGIDLRLADAPVLAMALWKVDDDLNDGQVARPCPRCGASIRDLGALSRVDNQTIVCGECGSDEAIRQLKTGEMVPVRSWPLSDAHRYAENIAGVR